MKIGDLVRHKHLGGLGHYRKQKDCCVEYHDGFSDKVYLFCGLLTQLRPKESGRWRLLSRFSRTISRSNGQKLSAKVASFFLTNPTAYVTLLTPPQNMESK